MRVVVRRKNSSMLRSHGRQRGPNGLVLQRRQRPHRKVVVDFERTLLQSRLVPWERQILMNPLLSSL